MRSLQDHIHIVEATDHLANPIRICMEQLVQNKIMVRGYNQLYFMLSVLKIFLSSYIIDPKAG